MIAYIYLENERELARISVDPADTFFPFYEHTKTKTPGF